MNTFTLIDSIHDLDQITKGTYFAHANDGQHYLIADSLAAIQDAAVAARADGHAVDARVSRSLTDADEDEYASIDCGSC